MGIDLHAYNFIEIDLATSIEQTGYCEPVLLALNAERVESLNFSDYEDATFIADLNRPLSIGTKFGTLIDTGSLEHVFDVATAFRNTISLCKKGGRILHFLPVNNLNGHGFWQFSSDLLYSIYSALNGFAETEVYYASSLDPSCWYRMPNAKPGKRIFVRRRRLMNFFRDCHLIIGLMIGSSSYSLNNPRYKKVSVDKILRGLA